MRDFNSCDSSDRIEQKSIIFEKYQDSKIYENRKDQVVFLFPVIVIKPFQFCPHIIIKDTGKQHENHIDRFSPGIKNKAAQKKNKILSDKEKCIVAYHEVGHAMVAALQSHSAPVQKITIVPRTSGALGFTMQVEDGDHTLMTKEEILAKIATMTGGRAAEEVVFNSITTGASNDIEQATKMARAMITRYGMTDDFDMVALETVNNAYLGGDASLACSERTAATVDDKVVEVVKQQHEKAKQMLIENRGKLDEIAKYLYEKETITGEEFMRILTAVPQLPTGAVEQ